MRVFLLLVLVFACTYPSIPMAASDDECAIWLCLPSGFGTGCGKAHAAFIKRIKKRKPPLPPFSSCEVQGKQSGRYQLGYERYEACDEGYVLREISEYGAAEEGICYLQICAPTDDGRSENIFCDSYEAMPRLKPNYIDLWFNEEYNDRYYY